MRQLRQLRQVRPVQQVIQVRNVRQLKPNFFFFQFLRNANGVYVGGEKDHTMISLKWNCK